MFGIADLFLLERRSADLAAEVGVPVEALDLALANFGRDGERVTQGAAGAEPDEATRESAADALGL